MGNGLRIFKCGEPPARVPYGKTVHRTVLPTLLRFATQGISRSAERDQRLLASGLVATLLKKGGPKTFNIN